MSTSPAPRAPLDLRLKWLVLLLVVGGAFYLLAPVLMPFAVAAMFAYLASPLATILSGALMLRWLGERHRDPALTEAAGRVDRAVETVLARGEAVPRDLGGTASCTGMTAAVCRALR